MSSKKRAVRNILFLYMNSSIEWIDDIALDMNTDKNAACTALTFWEGWC